MRRERDATFQQFRLFPAGVIRAQDEAAKELLKPCGRFRSPLPLEERLRAQLAGMLRRSGPLADNSVVRVPGIPLNWDLLIRYLHREGVAGDPHFYFGVVPNDVPHLVSGWIAPNLPATETDANVISQGGFASASAVEETISKAIGELLERHYFRSPGRATLVGSSYERLRRKRKTLDIFDLNGFLPWQQDLFPQCKRDAGKPLTWVRGTEIATGKNVYLPAQLVFWRYANRKGEPVLLNPTTNGCAGHFSRDEALLSSLLEIIQRDGFLIYWLNSLSPNVIDISSLAAGDAETAALLAMLDRYHLKAYFLDTSGDIPVPSLTCAIVDTFSGEPIIAIGSAAGFDLKDMVLHAAREALSIYALEAHNERFRLPEAYEPFRDRTITRRERLAAWKGTDMLERFRFLVSGEVQSAEAFMGDVGRYVTPEQRLAYVLDAFAKKGKGYEVYAYEVQAPVLKKLGYHLVRAIVPQMIPLYLAEHMPTLDSKRLREVPEKLGYKAAEDYNPWPHPFP